MTFADDLAHERCELGRPPETRRKRHRLPERLRDFRRNLPDHRRLEHAGCDRHHPDAEARELARHRQRHADETRLRRAVGGLPDLSVERRDRRREHNDAALAVGVGRALRHGIGGEPCQIERTDEVDVDRADEARERVRAVLADDLLARDDARAVDEPLQPAVAVERRSDRGLAARLVDDIGAHESCATPKLGGERHAFAVLEVRNDDIAASADDHA